MLLPCFGFLGSAVDSAHPITKHYHHQYVTIHYGRFLTYVPIAPSGRWAGFKGLRHCRRPPMGVDVVDVGDVDDVVDVVDGVDVVAVVDSC